MDNRLVSNEIIDEDISIDKSLRPRRLADFVGQHNVKQNLNIALRAAEMRDEPLDHVILYGPPGLGKTTLAQIIAGEMGVNIKVSSGPAIERAGDMAAILTSLNDKDILFIDEMHRLSRVVEEVLYPAMEDFTLSWVMGKGLGARNINLQVNKFTLIGATTRYSLVSAPLRDRFGITFRLEFYDNKAMELIVTRSAEVLGVEIDSQSISDIALRARGTPRVANRILKRVRDYAQVKSKGIVKRQVALEALDMLQIDKIGLDEIDHRLLNSMIDKFGGGPVGLETLAASVSEDPDTIMDVYEPYLLQLGLLERTPRGRMVTDVAYKHTGRPVPEKKTNQKRLL